MKRTKLNWVAEFGYLTCQTKIGLMGVYPIGEHFYWQCAAPGIAYEGSGLRDDLTQEQCVERAEQWYYDATHEYPEPDADDGKRPTLNTREFVVIRRKTAETMLSTIEDQFGTDEECPETGETICDFCGYTDSESAWFDICVALEKPGANEE